MFDGTLDFLRLMVPPEMVLVPREVLEQLAPEEPVLDSELEFCVWCEANGARRGSRPEKQDHGPGCPWLEARGLLGGAV